MSCVFVNVSRWLRPVAVLALMPTLSAQTPAAAPSPVASQGAGAPVAGMGLTPPQPQWSKLSPLGDTPKWERLEGYQGILSRAELEAAWRDIYSAPSPMAAPFEVEGSSLVIPTGNALRPNVRVELRAATAAPAVAPARYWRRAAELPPLNNRPPLSDLHIAIDPGHIGGDFARMEERFLSFQQGEAIREGDLTLETARVLAERLKELGASVSLVRDKPEPVTPQRPANLENEARKVLTEAGVRAPEAIYAGLTGDAKILTVQWQAEKLFYRVSEIRARAELVNDRIKPDVVLCLHFNAESWGAAEMPQFTPLNHLHVMINGCYAPVELEQQDVRFEMFHRLLNRVHEEELPLATAVAEEMAKATKLPPYLYMTSNARRAGGSAYVYARNLLANRLYQCPVVYLEPFVMNHEVTYRRLLMGHYIGRTLVAGELRTSAIEDYVSGVVQGLLAYYLSHRAAS